MNVENYLLEVNLPFCPQKLLEEYKSHEKNMIPVFNNSTESLDWYKTQDTWLFNKKPIYESDSEIIKIKKLVETILGIEELGSSPRFVLQKSKSELPMHVDWETTASLNIMLSKDAGPIEFEEFGKIFYKCALLNVKSPHRVAPFENDRLFLKIRMPTSMSYEECREKFYDYRTKS
jgi:hypothetical protein